MNLRQLLLRLHRKRRVAGVEGAIAGIGRDIAAVEQAGQVESLRGYEGAAAARSFPALGQLLTNPGFSLTERRRRLPRDPVNWLLDGGAGGVSSDAVG